MKRILILYYSGVGCTKAVAKRIVQHLSSVFDTEFYSIEDLPNTFDPDHYDGYVIGYPVYHTAPPIRVLDFFRHIKPLPVKKPAFLLHTPLSASCAVFKQQAHT